MNFFCIRIAIGLILSFCITFYVIPLFSKVALKLKFVDVPDGRVKKQEKPVPYLGGVALFTGLVGSFIFIAPAINELLLILPCITLLLFVGFIDDVLVLQPFQKFFAQGIATLCFLRSAFYLKSNFMTDSCHLFFLAFWILLVINAFNLIDVMDGLTSLVAMVATIFFLVIAIQMWLPSVILFLCCFMGSLCAFFYYNKPPARIYLGDAGSLCIGGIFATLPFLLPWTHHNAFGYLTPMIILAIPLLEIAALFLIRSWYGIPFYKASPHHFSLIFYARGWSKKMILLITGILAIIAGVISLAFFWNIIDLIVIIPLGTTLLMVWFFTVLFLVRPTLP